MAIHPERDEMREARRYFLYLCAVSALACSTTASQHALMAPRTVPAPRTGQPMAGVIEAGLAATPVAELGAAAHGDDNNSGVYIPRWQGRADLRFRTRGLPKLEVGFIHERALRYQVQKPDGGGPDVEQSASSAGISLYYASQIGRSRFHIGLGLDAQLFLIPFVHYDACIEADCETPFTIIEEERAMRPVVTVSATPSYRLPGGFALFWGMSARNHPNIAATGESAVESGPFTIIASGGLAYTHPGSGVRAAVHGYRVFFVRPVDYSSALALSLSIPLFRESSEKSGDQR